MSIQEIVEKFKKNPKYLTNGAGYLSKLWNTTRANVAEARAIVKGNQNLPRKKDSITTTNSNVGTVMNPIATALAFDTERVNVEKGEKEVSKVVKTSPKSVEDVKKIFGVDDISTVINQYWIKQQGDEFLVSALIKVLNKDFYSKSELKARLRELFPDTVVPQKELPPSKFRPVPSHMKDTLVIYISDDHVGMLLKNSLFGNENTEKVYTERLMSIVQEIRRMPYVFKEIILVSLGDQMNGYNQNTTRGGHIVPSLSNREQFDIYVRSRKTFYDELFGANFAEKYTIIEVNNSNHSGNGFSYMANEYLSMYIEKTFTKVTVENTEHFIQAIETKAEHVLILTHGKDECQQKNPFPMNLDPKTEIFFTDYILQLGYNPKRVPCHVIKGDLHRFNENEGKNFRYVNVGSIADGSEWQECNFGKSAPGVLLEIFSKGEKDPIRKIIRF